MSNSCVRCGIIAVIAAVALTGCANKSGSGGYGSGSSGGSSDDTYAASTYGAGDRDAFDGRNMSRMQKQLIAKRTFRFGFDRYEVLPQDYDNLNAHAQYLNSDQNHMARIEGHTDEQGSREYNVGLGERRGNAVSNYLISQGVSPSQIQVVSYGEEKPEMFGSDESAYSQNRRAVIVYER
tara:strand:- start:31862 stop:32401 length:540 start_codon:yes stop_codon:yes gene_type:complete